MTIEIFWCKIYAVARMRQSKERADRMNVLKLRARMVERGINVERLSEIIDIDRSSLYRKLNNGDKITIGEAQRIKSALELTQEDAASIFFG